MQRDPLFPGQFGQRVLGLAFLRGGGADRDDIFAALQQPFQNGLTKGLLAVNYDTHISSLNGTALSLRPFYSAASALTSPTAPEPMTRLRSSPR